MTFEERYNEREAQLRELLMVLLLSTTYPEEHGFKKAVADAKKVACAGHDYKFMYEGLCK